MVVNSEDFQLGEDDGFGDQIEGGTLICCQDAGVEAAVPGILDAEFYREVLCTIDNISLK